MDNKVTYPIYGSQSISAILEHIKLLNLSFEARVGLANDLKNKFKEVRFGVTFDKYTGKIENIKLLSDEY